MQQPRPGLSPLVLIAIATTIVAWASAFVVIRGVGPYFGGGALALGRLAVGAVLLGILALASRRWVRPNRREWLLIAGYGVFWFAVYNIALNTAEQTLDAGTTAMIVNIGPLLIAIGAGVILREGMTKWVGIGAGIAFVGVILIGIATGSGAKLDLLGVGWTLLAAITYAAGVLFQKPVLARIPSSQVTFLGCVIGLVACLPFTGALVSDLQAAPLPAVLGVVFLGAVPTALGFTTWGYALQRMPAGQLGISTYIVPPVVIVLGLLFFGEVPPALAVVGGAICLVGVALSRRRPAVPEPARTLAE
ncbi:MAG TPA: DMT family transporter [Rhodoglobus sp.]|nr:DMT family transporter [Rhodoglobus sp.]